MGTTLKIAGQFRVKPGSGAAFAKLVEDLGVDDYNTLALGENDMVVLVIDDNVSFGTYTASLQMLDVFVQRHSVLGAAILQTGDSPADWGLFGLDEDPGDQAKRDYFTWHRDYWQEQLDQLEAP